MLVIIECYMIQQYVLIVKHYHQNGKDLFATIHEVCSIFGENIVPNLSTGRRLFVKFVSTGSVLDVKHSIRDRCGHSGTSLNCGASKVIVYQN